MKIYTKTGDDGTTGLFGGKRVLKNDIQVEAYGDVDTLNSALGVACAYANDGELKPILMRLQSNLFDLGAELATDDSKAGKLATTFINETHVHELEHHIDAFEVVLPPLKRFILPGGTPLAAHLHVARSLCRQAERSMVTLSEVVTLRDVVLQYINRLSDFLFVAARYANHIAHVNDIEWQSGA